MATPVLLDRSLFPNDATYRLALASLPNVPWREPLKTFRFTIARTF